MSSSLSNCVGVTLASNQLIAFSNGSKLKSITNGNSVKQQADKKMLANCSEHTDCVKLAVLYDFFRRKLNEFEEIATKHRDQYLSHPCHKNYVINQAICRDPDITTLHPIIMTLSKHLTKSNDAAIGKWATEIIADVSRIETLNEETTDETQRKQLLSSVETNIKILKSFEKFLLKEFDTVIQTADVDTTNDYNLAIKQVKTKITELEKRLKNLAENLICDQNQKAPVIINDILKAAIDAKIYGLLERSQLLQLFRFEYVLEKL